MSERRRAGVRAYGGHRPIFRGDYSNDEKIYIWNTPLPLDGLRLTTAHTTTNQKKGVHKRAKYGGEVRRAGGVWEIWYHCCDKNWATKKKEKEIHHGLKWPQTNQFPHNNQPKIGVRNVGEYGREVRRVGGAWGKCDTIVWAEIWTTKIYIYSTPWPWGW